MLNPDEDLGRLASDALRVRHWMTRRVLDVHPEDLAEPTRKWMDALGLSVAPVVGQPVQRLIRRTALEGASPDTPIHGVAEAIALPHLVDAELPLDEALPHLAAQGWFFVLQGTAIAGIVSTSDLRRPAVSQYVLGRLLVIERGLDHLLRAHGAYHQTHRYRRFTDTVNNLLSGPASALRASLDLSGIHRSLAEAPLDLHAAHAGLHTLPDSLQKLRRGLPGRSTLRAWLLALRDLRNHLAHTGHLLDATGSAPLAHALIAALRTLSGRVWTQIDDRPQLWQAYHDAPLRDASSGQPVEAAADAVLHVITAANPRDTLLTADENHARNEALAAQLRAAGHAFRATHAGTSATAWPIEHGFAVEGMTRSEALALARRFQQRAIYELRDGRRVVIDIDGRERPRP